MSVPWSLPESLGALLLAFGLYVLGTGAFYAADKPLYKHHNLEFGVLAYQFLVGAVLLSAAVIILARFRGGPPLLGFRFPGWKVLGLAAGSVIGILLATEIIAALFDALFPGYHLQGNAKDIIPHGHIPALEAIGIVAWASIEAPLAEETLFRGILFQGVRHFFAERLPYQWAVAVAAVLSGTVFGLAHGEIHSLPILIVLGIALAYVFQLARSIYASMLVHGVINAISVIVVLNS